MRSLKRLGLFLVVFTFSMSVKAQTDMPVDIPNRPEQNDQNPGQFERQERKSIFNLVSEVRKKLGLDQKEFEKAYSAYEKFDKSVFGSSNSGMPVSPAGGFGGNSGRPGGRPGGGPGGGPGGMGGGPGGGHGGMGDGPGGGMRSGSGGMGGPGGGHDSNYSRKTKSKDFDPAKFEKTKTKAEEKLCKSMQKLFKKNPEKYDRWLDIRNQQLKELFPQSPQPPHDNTDSPIQRINQ